METTDLATLSVALTPDAGRPAYRQLYEQIRTRILTGRLSPGARLPASRTFAAELGVSRTTVVAAYDQLQSEGYIEQRRGAGAYVTDLPPEHLTGRGPTPPSTPDTACRTSAHLPPPLAPMLPELEPATRKVLARMLQRGFQDLDDVFLDRGDPFGLPALRTAIAAHLAEWRGLAADPARIIITSSSTESLGLVMAALMPTGSDVVMEDPGYPDMRDALTEAGRTPLPVPVDGEGLMTDRLPDGPGVRGAVVTPSRQFPLGMTLSLTRRLALLDWAAAGDRYVVEDDFDSEYRYVGSPLEALAHLDRSGRVIYLGSFSKVLFRALRISYLVVPAGTVDRFRTALGQRPAAASIVTQPGIAGFIRSGRFAAHLRRMRRLYGERYRALDAAIATHAADLLDLQRIDSGMHAIAWPTAALSGQMTDRQASARIAAAGLAARALSPFYALQPAQQGLILGFAGFDPATIDSAVARMATALRRPALHRSPPGA